MVRPIEKVRELLSDGECSVLAILFGDHSQVAVSKGSNSLAVSICLRGKDLRRQEQILEGFNGPGWTELERSELVKVRGRPLRVVLLSTKSKSRLLASLRKVVAGNSRHPIKVGQTKPRVVWRRLAL